MKAFFVKITINSVKEYWDRSQNSFFRESDRYCRFKPV